MPNTSATGGYLSDVSAGPPLDDDALVNFFQAWVVGITGLAGNLVRPSWQSEPPDIPPIDTNWAAIRVEEADAQTYAYEEEQVDVSAPDGQSSFQRHEELRVTTTFYGPNAKSYARTLRDGMQVAQNREALSAQNMGLVKSANMRTVPELIKEKWVYRVDLEFTIRRQIVRTYAVETIVEGDATLNNDSYSESIVAK